jgi:putative membrane protein
VSPSTADFVNEAAIGGMFEIQSSELAKRRGSAAEQSLAARMIDDHTKASNELKSLVEGGSVKADLPTALDRASQKKLDQLSSLGAAEFDKAYADAQISAHKNAVNLFERYAKGGDNEAFKQWASATLPTLRRHLEMAQDMGKNSRSGAIAFTASAAARALNWKTRETPQLRAACGVLGELGRYSKTSCLRIISSSGAA